MLGGWSYSMLGARLKVGGLTGASRGAEGDGLEWMDRDSEELLSGEGDRDWDGFTEFKMASA